MDQPYTGVSARDLPGVAWRRSRYSSPNGNCVEIARLPAGAAAVRDSKDPDGPALVWPLAAVRAFVAASGAGDFRKLVP